MHGFAQNFLCSKHVSYIMTGLCFFCILAPTAVFGALYHSHGHGHLHTHNLESGGSNEEVSVLQQKISEKKEKVAKLEKSIQAYKKKIAAKRLQATSLANQTAILDNRVAEVQLEIEATQQNIDAVALEVRAFELSIEEKQHVLERQKIMIAELLRAIHQNDSKKYIEIATNYNSFSDFYNSLQYLETVESNLGANVQSLRIAKTQLEEKVLEKKNKQELLENFQEEITQKKTDLEERKYAKRVLLEQTQSSERTYNTLLKQLKKQYQDIENEISGIEKEIRGKLQDQDKLDNLKGDNATSLSWPTQSRYITTRYRDPDYPYRHIFEHNAIDIRAAQGTPLKAVASGYVGRARRCSKASCYGYIMLIHSGGLSTVYGHAAKIIVSEDQFVTRGEVIGYSGGMPGTVGAGPFTTGPHLHFEVRKNGIPLNPLTYLIKDY
ncbi:MAG: hypothetical protein CL685_03240 [Candidatus Magasanikbacteria bacterium]|nr:hypothetical protein [Candidatus Magasanikbacteria bacterium]